MSTCCCGLMFKGNKTKKRDHNGSTDAIVERGSSFSRGSHDSELGGEKVHSKIARTDAVIERRIAAESRPHSSLSIDENDAFTISGKEILHTAIDFRVQEVGTLKNVQGLDHSQEDHIDLINALDHAKGSGQLSLHVHEEDFVILTLSKHGVKLTEVFPPSPKIVRKRYPLSDIIRIVNFEDEKKRSLLAVKIGKVGDDIYDCLVFQCQHQEQAENICRKMTQMFDAICEIEVLESDPVVKYRTL
ncbi:integrin beta-1-binding protein 1-like [Ptychodera flava]|uniref:integrin beta-1-binding protein 1-like n=1 Tax=Ptychodera flava TaxID=63121 RepID=UPI00396A5866